MINDQTGQKLRANQNQYDHMTKKGKKRKTERFIWFRSNSGREEQRRPESVAGDLTFGIGRELSLILKEIKVFSNFFVFFLVTNSLPS